MVIHVGKYTVRPMDPSWVFGFTGMNLSHLQLRGFPTPKKMCFSHFWMAFCHGNLRVPPPMPPPQEGLIKGSQWVFIVPDHKGPRLFLGGFPRGIGGVNVPLGSHDFGPPKLPFEVTSCEVAT